MINANHFANVEIDGGNDGLASPGDTVRYNLTVINTGSADATNVTINITPDSNLQIDPQSIQVQPYAVHDAVTIVEDAVPNTVSINLLANDAGQDQGETLVVTAVNGSQVPGTVAGAHGTLSWTASGLATYALDNSDPAVDGLNSSASLTETFSYTITDGTGMTDTDQLVVTIQGVNG